MCARSLFVFLCIPILLRADDAQMAAKHQALLKDYCVSCHGPKKQKGKFRADDLPFTITNVVTAERWQKVLNAMNAGDMPPEDEAQPPNESKADFLDDLSNAMVAARRNLNDQHGIITMRRLNRREYKNTLRDLLGVEINVAELPSDTGTGGFDTCGSNLFMSANQFEQYQSLGREALDEAFAWQAAVKEERKLHYEVEESFKTITKNYQNKLDAMERARQWVKAVEAAAAKPENAQIVAQLRKISKSDAEFRRSWAKIQGAPAPEEFGFKTVENNADKANGALTYADKNNSGYMRPYHEHYLRQPHLDTGAYLTISAGEMGNDKISITVPHSWPVGDYVVRVRAGAVDGTPAQRRFVEFGTHPRNGRVLSTHEVTGSIRSPHLIEIPLTLTKEHADTANRTIFIREKGTVDHFTQTRRVFGVGKARNGVGPELAIWVDWVEIERVSTAGKPPPPALAALGLNLNDKSPAPPAADILTAITRFAKVVFRGVEPQSSYTRKLAALYDLQLKSGVKPAAALKDTLAVVLASPMFLYLAEPAEDGKRRALTAAELATRLSYFLWSAPPDEELLRADLTKPEVLAAQTTRLLDDPRSREFVNGFVFQWLGMERLDFFEVNRQKYPRFDDSTRLAAKNEVYETFAYVLRHNAPLSDLLKADYAIINHLLGDFYNISGVRGDTFHRVTLPKGSPRGGLLGMAAVSVMGGNGDNTSPVERGAWVLRKLLNDPPPPAPANVPQLARLAGKVLTTRERLSAHQADAQCASCHRKIDPVGFGLENFDAVGQWRTEDTYQVMDEKGRPVKGASKTWQIEAAATLHKGPPFKSYFELRDIIASRSDGFAKGFSSALIEYALGRSIGFRDEPLIEDMLTAAKNEKLGLRAFIRALVVSKEFHTK